MKSRHYMQFITGMAVILLGISGARAATVVYQDGQMISEDTVSSTMFLEVTNPGTYKVQLADYEFPAPFDILTVSIAEEVTPQDIRMLGFGFGTGSFTFDVTTPGKLFANLVANPLQGKVGSYALRITAVPIPPAAALFFSGLIGLAMVGRRDSGMKAA